MRTILVLIAFAASLWAQHPTTSFKTAQGDLKLTAIRHASFMLEAGGQVLHCDPWS